MTHPQTVFTYAQVISKPVDNFVNNIEFLRYFNGFNNNKVKPKNNEHIINLLKSITYIKI
jgi:hypothetical protein